MQFISKLNYSWRKTKEACQVTKRNLISYLVVADVFNQTRFAYTNALGVKNMSIEGSSLWNSQSARSVRRTVKHRRSVLPTAEIIRSE